ncbi:hypothetical protein [Confluentibacter sediminis]|uniref:hypothetical protein n=1 Tax=Confluentibacter sediminis TaxID=2219045 RepID=UPI000DAD8C56|nr:hypothetical protein [Confluentibacter sediminis]
MENIKFENFIGKDISVVNYSLSKDSDNKIFGSNVYYTLTENNKYFYSMPYNIIIIVTNEEGLIQEVTIHFQEVINKNFFELFTSNYGNPDMIQVVNEISLGNEVLSESDTFSQTLRKGFIETKEGEFECKLPLKPNCLKV